VPEPEVVQVSLAGTEALPDPGEDLSRIVALDEISEFLRKDGRVIVTRMVGSGLFPSRSPHRRREPHPRAVRRRRGPTMFMPR
jgi:hypothetical protein